jgi:hypothetical protein
MARFGDMRIPSLALLMHLQRYAPSASEWEGHAGLPSDLIEFVWEPTYDDVETGVACTARSLRISGRQRRPGLGDFRRA